MVLSMLFWEELEENRADRKLFILSSPLILVGATILTVFNCVALSMVNEDIEMFWNVREDVKKP
jgi:hypothetical protein